MAENSILIIDDDADVLDALHALLEDEFSEIKTESTPNRISALFHQSYDVILLDMNFSAGINTGNEGLYWLGEILRMQPEASVVVMTAYGDINLAVESIKRGAKDFVLKPWDNAKLLNTVLACVRKRRREGDTIPFTQEQPFLEGRSKGMQELQNQIRKVAPTDASVLILGENGTGKELVARELHRLSKRAKATFLSVDLGTLSAGIFESELFGHKKGAFTDARTERIGRFESANGGTLFLDEIGNLPLANQAKLLTALQDRKVTPLGSNTPVPFDVRLVTATNAPLSQMAEDGTFRKDLLYRINTITLVVPPLRDRKDDILTLAEYFLETFSHKYQRPGLKFDKGARESLLNHTWPGNVRELRHTIEKTVILSTGEEISAEEMNLSTSSRSVTISTRTLDEIEKEALATALGAHGGNILRAAKALGITRQTLYNKMKKYGL